MALCAAGYLWFSAEASAEAYKMYRYTDAKGKRLFVSSMDDVPPEFRYSASAVMVVKEQPPEPESADAAKGGTANGGAVTVLSLSPSAAEDGKCVFGGEVKNGMGGKAENVKLHIEVKTKDGTKSFDVPVGAGGMMNAGETVKVAPVADVLAAELTGYSYNITWQSTRVESPPAKPARGQPPPEAAAAPKEKPAGQEPPPAPAKHYRTRSHPAAPPAGVEK